LREYLTEKGVGGDESKEKEKEYRESAGLHICIRLCQYTALHNKEYIFCQLAANDYSILLKLNLEIAVNL